MNEKSNYYIEYRDNTVSHFYAENHIEAVHYFKMAGDRAFDFGKLKDGKPEATRWFP